LSGKNTFAYHKPSKNVRFSFQLALQLCEIYSIPLTEMLPVAAVFMKLCMLLQMNCVAIKCCQFTYYPKIKQPELNLGLGLYLASSLVNHSCDANMYQVFYGTSSVFRATRPIAKNEQLTKCYWLPATETKYEERQCVLLEFYKFKCRYEQKTNHYLPKSRLNVAKSN
jgi:SET domain